jgi:hypothetical protein
VEKPISGASTLLSGIEIPSDQTMPKDDALARQLIACRSVTLLGGTLTFEVEDWPLLGKIDAPFLMAHLFDYTCPVCRDTHKLLVEAVGAVRLPLAALLIPSPVDPTCNPHIRRRMATHAHACQYARLGLLVWRFSPDLYHEFDRWIFEDREPPPLGRARQFAQDLLKRSDLDPSIPDPDIDKLIASGVALFQSSGSDTMPTFLFPHGILTGEVPSSQRLAEIMNKEFASMPLRLGH